jgi:hypothetical protein
VLARADEVIELRMTMSAFGTKRTFQSWPRMSANDPKRTFSRPFPSAGLRQYYRHPKLGGHEAARVHASRQCGGSLAGRGMGAAVEEVAQARPAIPLHPHDVVAHFHRCVRCSPITPAHCEGPI